MAYSPKMRRSEAALASRAIWSAPVGWPVGWTSPRPQTSTTEPQPLLSVHVCSTAHTFSLLGRPGCCCSQHHGSDTSASPPRPVCNLARCVLVAHVLEGACAPTSHSCSGLPRVCLPRAATAWEIAQGKEKS
jgi:hypothetical protein